MGDPEAWQEVRSEIPQVQGLEVGGNAGFSCQTPPNYNHAVTFPEETEIKNDPRNIQSLNSLALNPFQRLGAAEKRGTP